MAEKGEKIVCANRQAGFRYELLDKIEAGLMLVGSEVKSLRDGHAQLTDAYITHHNGEFFLYKAHISHYPPANQFNHDPTRTRKLLLHHHQIEHLLGKMKERGLTIIPTKIYFKKGKAKCEISLARGKKTIDKRETIKKKDQKREIERALKRR
ncbi:MAG: SsrA-binding protein SmpB [Deltaproteobacteria bacterium]|nr:MAG: SsrA-binding protein SmpB [Deltaproteobacteria bacterium]